MKEFRKSMVVSVILALFLISGIAVAASAADRDPDIKLMKKAEGFVVLADVSESMEKESKGPGCGDMSNTEAQIKLIREFSYAIPQLNYVGALRVLGMKQLVESKEDYSELKYGPTKFDEPSFKIAVDKLEQHFGITGMEQAIRDTGKDFGSMGGRKALVIISDFAKSVDFGDPVAAAKELVGMYPHLKIYTIGIGITPERMQIAQDVAIAGNGKYYDGCTMLLDSKIMVDTVGEIFYTIFAEMDGDVDGVPNELDKCPYTPHGAIVDEYGCWVAAYDIFFKPNTAELKEQYLPYVGWAADVIKSQPDLKVSVDGNSDNTGTEKEQMELGLRRAEAVRDALVQLGVPADRLSVKSYGSTRPIADNSTEEGRAANRRVDLTVAGE